MEKPPYLCKYRTFNDDFNNIEKIIVEHKLYFSSPCGFNDPFDCRVYPDTIDPKYFNRLLKQADPKLNKKEIKKMINNVPMQIIKNMMNLETGEVGMCSFSTDKRHIPMWSYYSSGHTGICLVFKSITADDYFFNALEVLYKSEYPPYELGPNYEERFRNQLLTKSDAWAAEQEYRCFERENGPGEYDFPPECLDEIILGCGTTKKNKEKIIAFLQSREKKPKLYQANIDDREFKLNFKLIKPI